MKKNISLSGLHIFSLFICLAFGIVSAFATVGTASVSGDWSNTATWGNGVSGSSGSYHGSIGSDTAACLTGTPAAAVCPHPINETGR